MIHIILILAILPIFGFIINVLIPSKNEKAISIFALSAISIHFILILIYSIYWIFKGCKPIDYNVISIIKSGNYDFYIELFYDKITFAYLFVGSFLTLLVTRYSRYYMHRETGFKRFFNSILFFYIGYTLAVLAGNFETLFIGWEILGISSFLLIAYYRDRYLPVKNANKVFSIYRIGDIGLILAMWASHYLWHENITFFKLHNYNLVHEHLQGHTFFGVLISLAILIAASAKSAQLPFSSWLPRAMEGPTPSSAIFYGSLSVHFGVFLLLRTFNFWEHQITIRILILILGLTSSIIATFIASVQSSVKSQIAYASIAQIGIIFIEISLGFETLALIHFAGNAFLRTYQLLVSPSVVSYMIREQFFNFKPRVFSMEDTLSKKMENTLYVLSLKEFNLDSFLNQIIWKPMKNIGNKLNFLTLPKLFIVVVPLFFLGLMSKYYSRALPIDIHNYLPGLYAFIGLVFVLRSFSERKSPLLSWFLLIINSFWIALAISFNDDFVQFEIMIYLSGVLFFGLLGYLALRNLISKEKKVTLNTYNGHVYEYPKISFIFLVSCLGVMGFPISPTFIGIDLIFSHIHQNQYFLAYFVASSYILSGIAAIRLYSRIFLGIHRKSYHERPLKSS